MYIICLMGAAFSVSIPSYYPDSIKGCKQAKRKGGKKIDKYSPYLLTSSTLEHI